jgi:hypothetical protein
MGGTALKRGETVQPRPLHMSPTPLKFASFKASGEGAATRVIKWRAGNARSEMQRCGSTVRASDVQGGASCPAKRDERLVSEPEAARSRQRETRQKCLLSDETLYGESGFLSYYGSPTNRRTDVRFTLKTGKYEADISILGDLTCSHRTRTQRLHADQPEVSMYSARRLTIACALRSTVGGGMKQ